MDEYEKEYLLRQVGPGYITPRCGQDLAVAFPVEKVFGHIGDIRSIPLHLPSLPGSRLVFPKLAGGDQLSVDQVGTIYLVVLCGKPDGFEHRGYWSHPRRQEDCIPTVC
ncbi:uncharacterized protein ARMOST_14884 [Armillaria ostoyae]|uniref:Uncharacterized protein n=1 Tax=Armillaria ostoyae TaxID=47428 RepID=A0A284RRU1_ARMOS|nr:uncharacterized protein ARMOST_14884 [Armillaria ostoyae]